MSSSQQDLRSLHQDLRALRDEVKVQVHLARMDLKDEWEDLEHQFSRTASCAQLVSNEFLVDLKQRLVEFRQRLTG